MSGNHTVAPIPGGFGAAGGPNDGWHNCLHILTKAFLRVSCKWGSTPDLRRRLDDLQMSVQGNALTSILAASFDMKEANFDMKEINVDIVYSRFLNKCGTFGG